MTMNRKLVSFILILTVVLLEPKLNVYGENVLVSFRKALFNYMFPKEPTVTRVRKPKDVITTPNNVTTLDFFGMVERYGYPAEEHYVTTEDGYNLIIHRIPGSPVFKGQRTGKAVLLQTGLFGSSDCWVLTGPSKDLAFLLADKGYDVWIGNFRGSVYGRSHIKLSPRDKEFWRFSFHEMGTRDLPAIVDYVLNYTKQKSLYYTGISMGTTVLFVFLSMRPEYNAKIKLGICLGPIALWKERPPGLEFVVNVAQNIRNLKEFVDFNEIGEIGPLASTTVMIGRTLCADGTLTQVLCAVFQFMFSGPNPTQLNMSAIPEYLSYYPAGSSIQNLYHYQQNIFTQKFQAYDYGHIGNYKRYKQLTPIMYDLKKITAPMAMFYGGNDWLALKSCVLELSKQLPNVVLMEEQTILSHLDFLVAMDVNTLVYSRVLELFQEFDNKV